MAYNGFKVNEAQEVEQVELDKIKTEIKQENDKEQAAVKKENLALMQKIADMALCGDYSDESKAERKRTFEACDAGLVACRQGKSISECPYTEQNVDMMNWMQGYWGAMNSSYLDPVTPEYRKMLGL